MQVMTKGCLNILGVVRNGGAALADTLARIDLLQARLQELAQTVQGLAGQARSSEPAASSTALAPAEWGMEP